MNLYFFREMNSFFVVVFNQFFPPRKKIGIGDGKKNLEKIAAIKLTES